MVYAIQVLLLVNMEILYSRLFFFCISEDGFTIGQRARDMRLDLGRDRYSDGFISIVKEGLLGVELTRYWKGIYGSLLGSSRGEGITNISFPRLQCNRAFFVW